MFAFGEPVEWLSYAPGEEDERGNVVDSWADPVTIDNCGFDPGASNEPRDGSSQRVVTDPVLYAPRGHNVGARDRFIVRGELFEVEGVPADWRNPLTGWIPPWIVISLRRVTG